MDNCQKFGVFTLALSLFFMIMVAKGTERIVFASGIPYSFIFLFHAKIEHLIIPKIKKPARAFGIAVVINGLIVEALAYFTNLERIQAGKQVYLFATTFWGDILISLPYYITLAIIYAWAVKKYEFSTLTLGAVIFLFWAVFVDAVMPIPFVFIGSHFLGLLGGNIPGFILAGFLMLFTLHAPMVIFENKINETYPARNKSWAKYPAVFALQYVSMVVTFIIVFARQAFFKV